MRCRPLESKSRFVHVVKAADEDTASERSTPQLATTDIEKADEAAPAGHSNLQEAENGSTPETDPLSAPKDAAGILDSGDAVEDMAGDANEPKQCTSAV